MTYGGFGFPGFGVPTSSFGGYGGAVPNASFGTFPGFGFGI